MSMVDVHFSNGPIRINTDLIPDYTRDYIRRLRQRLKLEYKMPLLWLVQKKPVPK